MNELYKLSMEMEVLRECYARLIADVDFLLACKSDENKSKCVQILKDVQARYNHIMHMKTFSEANEMLAVLKEFRRVIDKKLSVELSQTKSQQGKDKVLKRLFQNFHEEKHPTAKLVCAQPGAGKSFLIANLMDNNTAFVNGDEFRYFHPMAHELASQSPDTFFEDTRAFNGEMIEAMIDELSDRQIPLVVEGTLRRVEVPIQTKTLLEKKGYEVTLCVLAVPPTISYLRTLERAVKLQEAGSLPRKTNAEFQKGIVSNLVSHVDAIYNLHTFSQIEVYKVGRKEADCIYSLKETPTVSPALALEKEVERHFTKDEYDQYFDHFIQYVSKEEIERVFQGKVIL